ncbi:hypothetical protein IEQ34_011017 [Dendrobium chrysotoxum]|uniref:Uncharacterized protein n=1 Tax=Dendrobium chrysotoxum TaxID=161865 RepID=A0AAV7GY09_DENCH|nr:hypothetical protein IEQ34_011017 [Dendrobium chrysotoxum]
MNKLILEGNLLSGPIPSSLSRFLSLELYDLSNNRLTSGIPDELCEIEGLDIALDLIRNISILGKLSVLDLSYNNLDDSLAELPGLDNLISLNVSSNNFTGYLPDTKLFHQLSASDLDGNEGLCTHDGDVCFVSSNANGVTSTTKESRRLHKLKLAIILLIIVTFTVSMGNDEVIAVKKLWPSTGGVAATSKEKGNIVRVRDSFSAEVRTLGAILHKNIVRFLDPKVGFQRGKDTPLGDSPYPFGTPNLDHFTTQSGKSNIPLKGRVLFSIWVSSHEESKELEEEKTEKLKT